VERNPKTDVLNNKTENGGSPVSTSPRVVRDTKASRLRAASLSAKNEPEVSFQ